MKIKILFIGMMAMAGLRSTAQSIPQNLNNYITEASKHDEINGNILIAEQGKVLYKQSFGYRDVANQIPLTDSTLFPLASISKTFTAVSVLQLMEKGKLRLDDAFIKYFPDFPYPTITIRQMLSHTSGLPDSEAIIDSLVAAQPGKIFTNADDMAALQYFSKHKNLPFQPGERWGYSTVGYQFLALLVEKISGQPFAVYLKEHIFKPAGMSSTYLQTLLAQTKEKNRTLNYLYNNHYEMKLQWVDTIPDRKEWTYNSTGQVGGNNVVSTAIDLLKYDQALYSGALLKPVTLDEAFTPVKLNNGQDNQAVPGTSCGLGWFIFNDTSNGKIVWHSGSNPGITTLFVRNITKKQTYIILQNVACANTVYKEILDIITGHHPTYKQPLAFVYMRDMYQKGVDYAMSHLTVLRSDTVNYALKEDEIDRVGVEFSRTKYQTLALEAYKINMLLFPDSWRVYANYAVIMQRRNKDAAVMLYKKSLALNPDNENVKKMLGQLLSK